MQNTDDESSNIKEMCPRDVLLEVQGMCYFISKSQKSCLRTYKICTVPTKTSKAMKKCPAPRTKQTRIIKQQKVVVALSKDVSDSNRDDASFNSDLPTAAKGERSN